MGPVAGAARQGEANRKIRKRLAIRRADFSRTKNQQGKKCPGSMRKKG